MTKEEKGCLWDAEQRRMTCNRVLEKYRKEQEEKRKLEEQKDLEYREKQLQAYLKKKR